MATQRLLERLLPAKAKEMGMSVEDLRALISPGDMDTTATVFSADDDVSDVEIDADDVPASPPVPIASPMGHSERLCVVRVATLNGGGDDDKQVTRLVF